MKQLMRAGNISDANILPIYVDEEILQIFVNGSNGEKYQVSCNEYGVWHCECQNFNIHGLHEDTGSYLCKHIIAVLNYLQTHDISNMSEGLQ